MSYVSCASGFGVRKVMQGGVVPVIGSVGQDVLEMDIHSIHHWDDVTWPSGFDPLPRLDALSDQAGWGEQRFYSTIRTGDVDGDGRAEILARSAFGLEIRKLRGTRHHSSNPNRQPLRIEVDAGQSVAGLVWDDFADGMRLDQSDRLEGSAWIPSPGTGNREGSRRVLPLTFEGLQRFYRLWLP